MQNDFEPYLDKMEMNHKGTARIEEIEKMIGVTFPLDYKEFMQHFNGGEGEIKNSYVVLWKADELIDFNEAYAVNEFAPGLVLFGSDGADMAYAFDVRHEKLSIVVVPFIGMDIDGIKHCADSFIEFLKYLNK
jgi:hypothetical protein